MIKLYIAITLMCSFAFAYYLLPRTESEIRSDRLRIRFTAYGCSSCHVISEAQSSSGRVGPPLTSLGSRSYLAGRLPNTHDNLVRWIRFPQQVSPGTVMPNMNVSEMDAQEMAKILNEIK